MNRLSATEHALTYAAVTANSLNRLRCVRGFGDFFPYCPIAEGAVDIALDADLSLWDLAALDVLDSS